MLGIQEHVEIITQTAVITEKDQENQEDEDSQEDLSVNEDETRPKLFGFNNFLASNCFLIYFHCLKHILLVGDWQKKKALHVPINVPQCNWEKIIRWWAPRLRFGSSEMEMELWSWYFVHKHPQPNPPTSGHENGGFLKDWESSPKFVTSFRMLEVGTRYLKSLRLFMSAIQV